MNQRLESQQVLLITDHRCNTPRLAQFCNRTDAQPAAQHYNNFMMEGMIWNSFHNIDLFIYCFHSSGVWQRTFITSTLSSRRQF